MRNKLMWFYQEVEETEASAVVEQPKPGPSRTTAASNSSKTPQGNFHNRRSMHSLSNINTFHSNRYSFDSFVFSLCPPSLLKNRHMFFAHTRQLRLQCYGLCKKVLHMFIYTTIPTTLRLILNILNQFQEQHQPDQFTNINYFSQMDGAAHSPVFAFTYFA